MTDHIEPAMDEVMTPNPLTVDGETPLSEARSLMNKNDIRHLPVVLNGVVEAIISERDIEHFSAPARSLHGKEDLLVKDVCHSRIHLADTNDPLGVVLQVMAKRRIEAVLVMRNGELAGIFTESDGCRILAKHLGYTV
ncbi:MAG: CBS domain-containing protein [bacterium]